MRYRVDVLPPVRKALKEIDKRYVSKILERLTLLETDPRHNGSKKLSGEPNLYRTRVGCYRIIYKIFDDQVMVIVVNVDHRKDVYK